MLKIKKIIIKKINISINNYNHLTLKALIKIIALKILIKYENKIDYTNFQNILQVSHFQLQICI